MTEPAVIARWCCGALTALLAALVLIHSRRPLASRISLWFWVIAAAGGLVALIPMSHRLVHSNLGHYYIGAKYRIPYFQFYRVVTAALDKPQIGYRDLRHPHRFVRREPLEQRFYFLTLLRENNLPIPDRASTEMLMQLCSTAGLFRAEAERILSRYVPGRRISALREDLQKVRVDTDDSGFNGSPAYVLVRNLDPSLHIPFTACVGWINLVWQFGALLFALSALADALGWNSETRALAAASFFCSWDFNGWALNGLSFGGWLLPVALSIYGMSRRRPWLTGCAAGWATLIKLFPLVLLAPLGLLWLRAGYAWIRGHRTSFVSDTLRFTTISLAAAVLTICVGAVVSAHVTGMSWAEFFQKIHGQFERSVFFVNTASFAQILLALGVPTSQTMAIPAILYAWTLIVLTWEPGLEDIVSHLPRSALLTLALLGWVFSNWFNYYALVALFLLADLYPAQPRAVAAFLAAWGIAMLLPEYDRCYLQGLPLLGILKVLPFLALPAWALGTHLVSRRSTDGSLHASRWLLISRVIYPVGLALVMFSICASVYRVHASRAWVARAAALVQKNRLAHAAEALRAALRHDRKNAFSATRLADVLDQIGQTAEAEKWYTEAARLDPEEATAWMNLGLLTARNGDSSGALRLLSRAARTAPHDPLTRYNYAVALKAAGQTAAAREEAQWAVWLAPDWAPPRVLLNHLLKDPAVPEQP